MNILSLVKNLAKPVTDVIDDVNTSKEEKMLIEKAILEMEQNASDLLVETQGKIIEAEAKSEHFLTSTWRPITALVFVAIVANNYIIAPYTGALFGTEIMLEIPNQMWDLITLMIGGYVGSRGVEKVAKEWKK
jgi:hypothetical protein